MKKFWKALGITALAAAVIPYRFRKDQEAGTTSVDALMWQVARRPGDSEDRDIVDISFGFKSPFHEAREEKELFTDNPEEAVLFADDEPEAAVVTPADLDGTQEETEPTPGIEEAETAGEPEAEKSDFDPEA